MPDDLPSAELLKRFAVGDEAAATEMFRRYAERLTALARARISAKLAARIDPDDVVMSAYRSFFMAARDERYELHSEGDLWRLLVQITLHKLYRQAAHHQAGKRAFGREVTNGDEQVAAAVAAEPSPESAAEFADQLEAWLARIPPTTRRIVELRLQGDEIAEIARVIGCSSKTIQRHLTTAKAELLRVGGLATGSTESFFLSQRLTKKQRRNTSHRSASRKFRRSLPPAVPLALYADYLLKEQTGTGTMGKVYRAIHKPTGTTVAIKFLRKAFLRDEPSVARFIAEAQAVAQFRHPHIVAVQSFGQTPHGSYFIVMDWLPAGDLAAQLPNRQTHNLPFSSWLADAAAGLGFVHEQGLVHCDIKPSNLLLDDAGRVRVTDFGFARRAESGVESPLPIAGTPSFMAPEQVDATWGKISPATDIYGLGAVLYQFLFGQPPHTGSRIVDVLANVVAARPVSFPQNPNAMSASSHLHEICRRCLAKRPQDRFATMAELERELRAT